MSKLLLDIKVKYQNLSKSEKKVADYIIKTPNDTIPLLITDLAQICQTSEASIVRFAKKLGFKGYQQFKIALVQETRMRPVNVNIDKADSSFAMFEKICEEIYSSLEKTKQTITPSSFQRTCEAILSADKILVFGLGNSASIAMDCMHKMFRLGLNISAYTDNHMQAIAAAHANEKTTVIGISHSGQSKDVIEAMQTAKSNGATTIAITNIKKSPIENVSDILLKTVADETNYRVLGLSSRITQLAIIDALYSYLACNLKNAEEKIDKTELVLKTKKVSIR